MSTDTFTGNSNDVQNCNIQIRNTAKKRWFILEPAVFFVFGAISLSGLFIRKTV